MCLSYNIDIAHTPAKIALPLSLSLPPSPPPLSFVFFAGVGATREKEREGEERRVNGIANDASRRPMRRIESENSRLSSYVSGFEQLFAEVLLM